MKTSDLKSVPTFTFYQEHEEDLESPVNVSYYNGTVELEQNGDSILIVSGEVDNLFKAIKKNRESAEYFLGNRN